MGMGAIYWNKRRKRLLFRRFCSAGWFAALMLWGFPATVQAASPPADVSASAPAYSASDAYTLDVGDRLRLTVFGEADLGGEYVVDGSGNVRLPLIGQVRAAGLALDKFEEQVKSALEQGYLKDAKVSAEVIGYRPFYILGQVNKPGEYGFVNGMNVLTAIALAGGYTHRANETNVLIRHKGSNQEQPAPADQTTKVMPGDIIRVRERFF